MSKTRTRIKICGMTNAEDARAAVEAGADALGFIAVPGTPRYIAPEQASRSILRYLPPFVTSVVVVKACEEKAMPDAMCNFGAIQFYEGDCSTTSKGTTHRIRAFRVQNESSLTEIASALQGTKFDALLLDAYHKDKLGGSGETFNWDLAVEAKARFGLPIILAGGLTPENVGEAIRKVRPYGVDVSSGVEAEPGRKDWQKVRAFVEAVRAADSESGMEYSA